eukprot:COSAG02_NODE_56149_length_287_cov_0.335106_1_plen_44_part_00
MGNPDPSKVALYQMWDVGLANAVPNKDWELFFQAEDGIRDTNS